MQPSALRQQLEASLQPLLTQQSASLWQPHRSANDLVSKVVAALQCWAGAMITMHGRNGKCLSCNSQFI